MSEPEEFMELMQGFMSEGAQLGQSVVEFSQKINDELLRKSKKKFASKNLKRATLGH